MLKTYRRREDRFIQAIVVTRDNAADVARHLHGRIEEDPKASDPTDVAIWIVLPTLDAGPPLRHLVTGNGPVIAVDPNTGEIDVWADAADFFALYELPTR